MPPTTRPMRMGAKPITSEHARPEDDPRQQVPAEVVGAEEVAGTGPDVHRRVVLEVGGLERQHRGQHGQQDHEHHPPRADPEGDADARALPGERGRWRGAAPPRLAPAPMAALTPVRPWTSDSSATGDGGSRQARRTRGSRTVRRKSTAKFTTTKATAATRAMPWTTR